jgi:hypothetical protein
LTTEQYKNLLDQLLKIRKACNILVLKGYEATILSACQGFKEWFASLLSVEFNGLLHPEFSKFLVANNLLAHTVGLAIFFQ